MLEMVKKAYSKSMFQDEWFSNKKFADWIGKTYKLAEAQCLVSKKSIDISLTGVSTLDFVGNTTKILKIQKGWAYHQCLTKRFGSQLLPNKRLQPKSPNQAGC